MSNILAPGEFDDDEFRISLGTMESTGRRKWIFPKKPSGKFYKWRTLVSWVLLIVMFVSPFIKVNGNQLFQFDIFNREFYIFGYPFFPQDFYLVAIGVIGTLVFIILFTQIYGRIFCGWICPQTIFMEMVFRKIEYAVEGDRAKQMKLARQKWDAEKITKKLLLWSIYFVISFAIANIFLSYIVGSDRIIELIKEGPGSNIDLFGFVLAFTAIFLFIFGWFREQACTLVCPYGRLQGVLVDKNTIAVTYDYKRGEAEAGRSRYRKGEDRKAEGKGDCIDCQQCVVVCPTGIDIRNGTQLECINCTACIDACDEVMNKINLPTGLIRYTSENDVATGQKFKFNIRYVAYTAVLVVIMIAMTSLLTTRSDVDSKFFRTVGTNYKVENNKIINQYTYVLINKTNDPKKLIMKLVSHKGNIEVLNQGKFITIKKGEKKEGTAVVTIPKSELRSYMDEIIIEMYDENGKKIDRQETNFQGPVKYN